MINVSSVALQVKNMKGMVYAVIVLGGEDMQIVILLLLSVLSSVLYRLGGSSTAERFKWWPLPDLPKERDVGCSLCLLIGLKVIGIPGPWWAYFIVFGLTWGALSTYWDWITGKDNHYLHGLGVGLATLVLLPWAWGDPVVNMLIARVVITALGMGIWSKINGNATREELGRGFLVVIPLMLVWLL